MTFLFAIPTLNDPLEITINLGTSAIFVGANGGGKTRLAVYIENQYGAIAHRISAHRSLSLNPSVPKISEKQALSGLRTGYVSLDSEATIAHRSGNRWQRKEAVYLLNDYDFLVQALFADQSNKALNTHTRNRAGDQDLAPPTNFEKLIEIWHRLLPHRKIETTGDDIKVSSLNNSSVYKASDMSDGERAMFYLIGQTLTAAENSLLIFDEPELHIHRSIMSKLWDELEAARTDCAFIFITHDLDFAAARKAQKFVLREYHHATVPYWSIETVPESTGFDESLTTLILGSRKPILFVEGVGSSLDAAIYRCCYPDWTVIPKGSCQDVIHAVATFRNNLQFSRISCAGILDADDYQSDEIEHLQRMGIHTLCVSEIENVLLLPTVSRAIASTEGYTADEISKQVENLENAIYAKVIEVGELEKVVVRFCKRRIDRILKKVDLADASTVVNLENLYQTATAAIRIDELAQNLKVRINKACTERDLSLLLACFDNKGLVSLAAQHLKKNRQKDFLDWLLRVLRNNSHPNLTKALRDALPVPISN